MGDLRFWDVVRYLADRAETRLTELNPVVTRKTDGAHLRDPDFHRAALAYREERLLGSVARRLKARLDDGMDSFQAMNECQTHLVALARAHVERLVLDAFHDGVARAPTPGLSEVLGGLASLYALDRLDAHAAWYLETGYFASPKSRAIRGLVEEICGEIRECTPFFVDAFGIPDGVLAAPAAMSAED